MTYSLLNALTPGANENITDVAEDIQQLAADEAGRYRTVFTSNGYIGDQFPTGTYMLSESGVTTVGPSSFSAGNDYHQAMPSVFYWDDADYTLSGLTLKLRVRFQVAVNTVATGINHTAGLYPVTVAGGNDVLDYTPGIVVSGSTVAHSAPATSTITQGNSGDFAIPSDGAFCLAVLTSGSMAANSVAGYHVQLQVRAVV